jgi:hypothetical protein
MDTSLPEEDRWRLVNSCETAEELVAAILCIGIACEGEIPSNRQARSWKASRQMQHVVPVVAGAAPATLLTRAYGIRQQALYIQYYEQLRKPHDNNANTEPASSESD